MIRGNYKDLFKKIGNTISMIFVYRIGCYITLPGVNPLILNKIVNQSSGGFLSDLDIFAGGSIARASLFSLSVYPYISASLLMQFLSSSIGMEYFIKLKNQGNGGQEQINAYTKYITLAIGLAQSIGYCTYIATQKYQGLSAIYLSKKFFFFIATIHMIAGLVFLIWLGNQITKKGICNGISLIIFTGIVSAIPKGIMKIGSSLFNQNQSGKMIIFMLFFAAIIILCLFVETSKRNIPVRYPYSKLFKSTGISNNHNLPMKINNASIMPAIMSAAVIMLPGLIRSFLGKIHISNTHIDHVLDLFARGNRGYHVIYGLSILTFTIMYTPMTFEAGSLASQLHKSNCILSNWRPGMETAQNLDRIINNLSFLAAIYLFVLCVFVDIFITRTSIPMYFSGTSILIAVGVGLEIYDSYKAHSSDFQCISVVNKYTIGSSLVQSDYSKP